MRIEVIEEGRNSKSPDTIEGNPGPIPLMPICNPVPAICRMAKIIELLMGSDE